MGNPGNHVHQVSGLIAEALARLAPAAKVIAIAQAKTAEKNKRVEELPIVPSAESLIQEMKLEERYKDVTFETLNRDDFLESVKEAFPRVDWEKAYSEFKAAGESERKDQAPK